MKIYKITYIRWTWCYEWTSETYEEYVSAQNEDEALSKVLIPLLKEHQTIELKSIKQIIVE